ncbi:MAG: helix-turn-helix transcriptional regulator [Oscillospiraceae bacterium]|nr:helix-turn-helix transcriptional regulator [Oscillospiraceae bacterium]MCI9364311.1 helix-turn-helix transcriptional regulator [Oscillospiraceae bacterium]RKJ56638.1 XRE family transcriptional regulator [bacterium 1XD42-8]RKJ64978.1 XRE family transcriptional regulator [bacterium 1XD42-1]
MVDYSPLWETMEKKQISQYYLIKHGIDNKTIYKLKRNCHISTLTMEKLCKAIGCQPNDIVKFID